MHDDDRPIGRVLTRREVLASLGAAGVALTLPRGATAPVVLPNGTWLPACLVRPAQTEGPYFVDEKLLRVDVRSDPSNGKVSAGPLLDLSFNVSALTAAGCAPLAGAIVDIWQCDAQGVYSDVKDIDGQFNTVGQKFLRGHQVTGANGLARFTTIYPGWYPGRAVHLHFKVRTQAAGGRPATEFTSQLYFDERITDEVHAQPPYAAKGRRNMLNEKDSFYAKGGAQLMLQLKKQVRSYVGAFELAVKTA